MRRSEDNLWELVVSFHHVSPGVETRVDRRLGGNYLYLPSHFAGPSSKALGKVSVEFLIKPLIPLCTDFVCEVRVSCRCTQDFCRARKVLCHPAMYPA